MDLIDRQAAIDALCKAGCGSKYCGISCDDVKAIEDLPSAQSSFPQRHENDNFTEVSKMDCISRQAAIDTLKGLEFCQYMEFGEYIGEDTREVRLIRAEKAQDMLQNLPSAQPERKCGRWEMLQIPISPPVYKCSVCGSHALQTLTGCLMNRHYESNLTKFCPNCGADMREGEADG